jgi:hypothetical protein
MSKFIFSTVLVLLSINAFAADYSGVWCQKFDDFTHYMIIDDKDNVESFSRGNGAGEIVMEQKGYASLGASRFHIVLDKHDIGVVDYKVKKSPRALILIFENGVAQKFLKCEKPK